jgi:hypothetical protein
MSIRLTAEAAACSGLATESTPINQLTNLRFYLRRFDCRWSNSLCDGIVGGRTEGIAIIARFIQRLSLNGGFSSLRAWIAVGIAIGWWLKTLGTHTSTPHHLTSLRQNPLRIPLYSNISEPLADAIFARRQNPLRIAANCSGRTQHIRSGRCKPQPALALLRNWPTTAWWLEPLTSILLFYCVSLSNSQIINK